MVSRKKNENRENQCGKKVQLPQEYAKKVLASLAPLPFILPLGEEWNFHNAELNGQPWLEPSRAMF